ncbi:hypothetical protein M758_12G020000 [Ceratodon purpureus]|nr:hypothetical protein M758_12G020000 [Ceratodon purpureus]
MLIDDEFTDEHDASSVDDFPGFEAYQSCYGLWRNVRIFKSTKLHQRSLVVHAGQEYDCVPVHHLRIRSKPYPFCNEIHCDSDVVVFTRHPDSGGLPGGRFAWFDARVMNIERKQHSSHSQCECVFGISLYEIPEKLPLDWKERKLLPEHDKAVRISDIFSLREAAPGMSFDDIIAASLTGTTMVNSPGIQWVTDGKCWYSSYAEYQLLCQPPEQEQNRRKKSGSTEPELVKCNDSNVESGLLPSWDPCIHRDVVVPAPKPDREANILKEMHAAEKLMEKNAKRIRPAKRRRRDNDDDLHSIPDNYLDHDNSSSGQESD